MESGGKYKKVYDWLAAHAHEYGFCQPYTAGRSAGYKEEKWHWSYTPLSQGYTERFRELITDEDFSGFSGASIGRGDKSGKKLRTGHQREMPLISAFLCQFEPAQLLHSQCFL
jgi:hypothetical protein